MSGHELPSDDECSDQCRDLGLLLAGARTDEPGLHAFYLATAPRLACALSATRDETLTDEVLVRTYRRVRCDSSAEVSLPTGDEAVFGWLMRIALVELVILRRGTTIWAGRGPVPPGPLR